MVRDKKFTIAVVIIVILAAILLYALLIKPSVDRYITNKQVNAQQVVVKSILDIVQQQGYIALSDGNRSVALVDSRLCNAASQNNTGR